MLLNRDEIRQDKTFDMLTEAILERDQPRTTDLFFRMVARDGRSVGEALSVVTAAEAPFVQVPSHINVRDGQISLINNDHTILGLRASAYLMPYLPEKYRLLPLLQSVWYIPAGLDIWNQLLGKYPGRYATMKGINVPPPSYGPVVWNEDQEPIREKGTVEERLHQHMIATVSGDLRRSYGLFLGLAEDEEVRPMLADQLQYLGLIDLQDTVIGRKARNTGHKAIRARSITDLADFIGWDRSHGVYYMGVPDMAIGPLYYSLYDAVCVRMASEFPDGGVNLKQTNQTPLSPAETEEMVRQLMEADADTVWDLLSAHLKSGKSIRSLGDAIQIGAAELILRTTVPRQFTNGQHPFDYCNVANNWMRRSKSPYQPRILYLMASFINDVAHENKLQNPVIEQECAAFDFRAARLMPYWRARRGDHGARLPARHGCGQCLSAIRRRPQSLSGHRRARRLPVPGRPAQPEDHDLDLRGIRPQLDPSARSPAACDDPAARGLGEDAGRARLLRPVRKGLDLPLTGGERSWPALTTSSTPTATFWSRSPCGTTISTRLSATARRSW